MAKNSLLKLIGSLACAGVILSTSQSRWFYSFVSSDESKMQDIANRFDDVYQTIDVDGREVRFNKSLLPEISKQFEFFNLPKTEILCPEHEAINGYVPVSKDPKVIYFWNRVIPVKTNDVQNIGSDRYKIRRLS